MEELEKALNERSLTISTLPDKGRCLFTTRDFSPGEVIISENPYVSVPNKNKESPNSKCEWCFSSANLKKCSACHVIWYCSSKCQKSDWKLHSAECRALSKVDKERLKSLTPSLRLMVKLCIRRKLEIEKKERRRFEVVSLSLQLSVANWNSSSASMEELERALNERNLTISTLPDKGRCLFTTRDFSPGEVIIRENPYVSIPNKNKESPNSKCEWCFSSANLKKCSACHVVWYCSSKCQKSDWKLHSAECRALSKVDKERLKSLTPSLRLMVKLCIRRKLEIEKIIPTSATQSYKNVEALVSHISDIDEKQLVMYAQMANLVNLILQWPSSQINIKEIAENFSKLACNAHSICDSELRPLGTGLYPVISILNHSCLPNSVLVFEERLAVVRAMQHITKGTEVLISYVDIAGSTITRQKALKEQYYFLCACSRCIKLGQPSDIRESAILEGYRCKDNKCDGILLRDSDNRGFICQQCGLLRDKEEIANMSKEVKSFSEKASMSLSSGYKIEAIEVYKRIERLQLLLYHPFSINLMRTRETLLKIFMEVEDWREALSYCRLTIPSYERVYPASYPLVGLQYFMRGKFEWLLGDAEAAVRSLTKALDILRVTHGTTTPFMVELATKLDEARAEAYMLPSPIPK